MSYILTLHFLVLFLNPTVLFQLLFNFIYGTFNKKNLNFSFIFLALPFLFMFVFIFYYPLGFEIESDDTRKSPTADSSMMGRPDQ